MPNTTSGTATFDKTFAIDDIIEESFQRIGFDNITGYQMKSARRSLNIMFQEWGNRGLHYWEIDETNIDLIEGQAEYHFFRSAADDTSDSNRAQAPQIKWHQQSLVLMMFWNQRTGQTEHKRHNKMWR